MSSYGGNEMMTSLNILDLPEEILGNICAWLCPHCLNGNDKVYPDIRTRPLKGLTLASKRFRSIALPFFFHQLRCYNLRVLMKYQSLYPQIALHCQDLHIEDFWNDSNFEVVRRHFKPLVFENLQSLTLGEYYINEGSRGFDCIPLLNDMLQATPAIRTLQIYTPDIEIPDPPCGVDDEEQMKNALLSLSTPKSLRHLLFFSDTPITPEDDLLVEHLFRKSESLITARVTCLFSDPLDIWSALVHRRDALRSLKLITKCDENFDIKDAWDEDKKLSSFVALEKLTMSDGIFVRRDGIGDECLVECIPISLQKLTLHSDLGEESGKGIWRLAKEISHGRFPNLRHIVIKCGSGGPRLGWKREYREDCGFHAAFQGFHAKFEEYHRRRRILDQERMQQEWERMRNL
ncbi:hypothetical protein E4U42_006621 [Claviceps africana]|uniref:Uncharacterized protein n=1 Tax=Claviceps africana TaxID=83212 RepID=A0A8K0J443_9HYPO|nr:hypothetical protein E4U42_006621 [Claviceps africana]